MYFNWMNPWQETARLQQEMNRLFDNFNIGSERAFPPVNVWSNDDSALVTAELAGLDKDDLKLSVMDQKLILEGTRKAEQLKENETYHRQERGLGDFRRTIQLPFSVDENKISAQFKNGVLTVTLPRAEQDKPKRIAIATE